MKRMTNFKNFISSEMDYRSRCSAAFKKCSYGNENRDKKFRVLCNRTKLADKQGLLSTMSLLLPNMIEARAHGYIPVVDLKKNRIPPRMLQEPYLAKKENAWEYYFTQPDKNISLEEVRRSRYVEEQVKECRNYDYYIGDKCPEGGTKTQYLSKAIRRNIHLQPGIKSRVLHEKHELFAETNKVLGVAIRAGYRFGALNKFSLYDGHPMVSSCTEYIKGIEKKLQEWNYNSFFLVIDDEEWLEAIKNYFGKSCIYMERPRMHYFEDALNDIPQIVEGDPIIECQGISIRTKEEDYLVELYLLAQCDGLYASRGTGHNFAYLLNNGRYSHVEFIDMKEFNYKG